MPKVLEDEQVDFYREQGYLAPLSGVSGAEAAAMCASLEEFERIEGFSVGSIHFKGHLCFTWSHALTARPEILDAVEDLIGPDILIFASKFWVKPGGDDDGAYVSWHQDSAYFGLEPHDLATVWIALTDSNRDNGCLRVLPGSHRGPAYRHSETFAAKNLLARGQAIEGLDDTKGVDVELAAGQFSVHHEHTVHGSLPNQTAAARIGLSLFYVPAHVRSTLGRRTATLVRGTDRYGHWDLDPIPERDRDPAILDHMRAEHRRYHDRSVAQEAEEQAETD